MFAAETEQGSHYCSIHVGGTCAFVSWYFSAIIPQHYFLPHPVPYHLHYSRGHTWELDQEAHQTCQGDGGCYYWSCNCEMCIRIPLYTCIYEWMCGAQAFVSEITSRKVLGSWVIMYGCKGTMCVTKCVVSSRCNVLTMWFRCIYIHTKQCLCTYKNA